MPAKLRKIRRRRPSGEIMIEQTHDAAVIEAMLKKAASRMHAERGECFLIAYWGDEPIGIAGLETEVDAALMCPLFVVENMRQRGVGACLVSAVRRAADTRGARTLYAIVPAALIDFFTRLGFDETACAELDEAFGQPSMLQWMGPNVAACRLDISHDGLIER